MSTSGSSLPPNPSLVAILLVVRTRADQPQLVFHYPHSPNVSSTSQAAPPAHASWYGGASTGFDGDNSSTEQSSDSDEERSLLGSRHDSEPDRDEERRSKTGSAKSKRDGSKQHTAPSGPQRTSRRDVDDELEAGSGDEDEEEHDLMSRSNTGRLNGDTADFRPDWDRVLGIQADALSKFLTPNRTFNKKRFETGIDNLVFLGCPMFVKEDGTWTKRKKGKASKQAKAAGKRAQAVDNHSSVDATPEFDSNVSGYEAGYGHDEPSRPASEAPSVDEPSMQMTMFHVVFVLNPPPLEYNLRIDDMYDFVAKKLARFFKHEQARRQVISEEVKKITSIKERGRETRSPAYLLWPAILAKSSLARVLVHVFDAISDSQIAHVHLEKSITKALQIPRAESTPYISTATEPQVPGLWLTTTPFAEDEMTDPVLNAHSALLLLEDEDVLIRDIEVDNKALVGPLTWFIRNITPTKSLQKQFSNNAAALLFKDSLYLARYLINWRRARAIPPLHHRDTYIVSPNADLRALTTAIPNFATRFPTLPSLPKILERLSGPPRPYYTLMPSKDHRDAYMDILAWLMRGGWVTQLKSFAWISVPIKVKQEVMRNMRDEAKAKATARLEKVSEAVEHATLPLTVDGHRLAESAPERDTMQSPNGSTAPSPRLSAYRSPSHPASEAGSISSERTAIPYRPRSPTSPPQQNNVPIRPSPLHVEHQPSREPSPTHPDSSLASSLSENSKNVVLADVDMSTPSLIQAPMRPSTLEARWIDHIGAMFEDRELAELWPTMLRYLDGKHALDEIALREGMKRKSVASIVLRLRDAGILLTVRHW